MNPSKLNPSSFAKLIRNESTRKALLIANNILAQIGPQHVLDVGAGDAVVSQSKLCKSYCGVEVGAGNYPLANGLHLAKDIADTIRFCNYNTRDLVLALDVLEHVEEPGILADVIFKCSNKYVAISLPNETGLNGIISIAKSQRMPGHGLSMVGKPHGYRHMWLISYNESLDLLKKTAEDNMFELVAETLIYTRYKSMTKRLLYSILRLPLSERFACSGFFFLFKRVN